MAQSEDRERMAAALAMASLADSVPGIVPATVPATVPDSVPDSQSPPPPEQDTQGMQTSKGTADKKKKPKLPKLTLPAVSEAMSTSTSTPSPGTQRGTILPKVPQHLNLHVKHALVQKLQGSAAQRQISESVASSPIPETIESSSLVNQKPVRGRGRGRPRGRGNKKVHSKIVAVEALGTTKSPADHHHNQPTVSYSHIAPSTTQLSAVPSSVDKSKPGELIMRSMEGHKPSTAPISATIPQPFPFGKTNVGTPIILHPDHKATASTKFVPSVSMQGESSVHQTQGSSGVGLVHANQGSSGGLVQTKASRLPLITSSQAVHGKTTNEGSLGQTKSSESVGESLVTNPSTSHPPLHQMKLPENLKAKYETAMQQFTLSPITPPEGGLLPTTATTGQNMDKNGSEREQSEPLDLSTVKEKAMVSPQMYYTLPPTGLPAGMIPMPIRWPPATTGTYTPDQLQLATIGSQGQRIPLPITLAGSPNVLFPQFLPRPGQPFLVNPGLLSPAMSSPVLSTAKASESERENGEDIDERNVRSESRIIEKDSLKPGLEQIERVSPKAGSISGANSPSDSSIQETGVADKSANESLSPGHVTNAVLSEEQNKKLPPKKRRRMELEQPANDKNGEYLGNSETSDSPQVLIQEGKESDIGETPITKALREENSGAQAVLLSADSGIGSLLKSPTLESPVTTTPYVLTSVAKEPPLPRVTDAVAALRSRSQGVTKPQNNALEAISARPVIMSVAVSEHVQNPRTGLVGQQSKMAAIARQPAPVRAPKQVMLRPRVLTNTPSDDRVQSLPHDLGGATKVTRRLRPLLKRTHSMTAITSTPNIQPKVVVNGDARIRSLPRDLTNQQRAEGERMRLIASSRRQAEDESEAVGSENEAEVTPDILEECQRSAQADEDGDLPIHIAVVHGNLPVMDRLLYMMRVAKIPIDYYNNLRQTPLHLAIITQNDIAVTRLLEHNANPNLPDRKGMTGLHLAVKYRTKASMKAILENASCELQLDCKNYEGFTALHLAVIDHQAELVQLLVDAGAALDVVDGKSGRTALFHAAEAKMFNIASLLLQKGASVNTTNYSGNTAVQAANGRGHTEMVALFIKYGADVSNSMRDTELRGETQGAHAMSQVKETVRENTLKRQHRKRQLGEASRGRGNIDPRGKTVGVLLQHDSRTETPPGGKNVIAISPSTPTTPGVTKPRIISQNTLAPKVPESGIQSQNSIPQQQNQPNLTPGPTDKEQELKNFQLALLEKIAPSSNLSPKRKSQSSSTSSMPSVSEVVVLENSPQSSDTESEDVSKRAPLTIDPRMISIPTKMRKVDEKAVSYNPAEKQVSTSVNVCVSNSIQNLPVITTASFTGHVSSSIPSKGPRAFANPSTMPLGQGQMLEQRVITNELETSKSQTDPNGGTSNVPPQEVTSNVQGYFASGKLGKPADIIPSKSLNISVVEVSQADQVTTSTTPVSNEDNISLSITANHPEQAKLPDIISSNTLEADNNKVNLSHLEKAEKSDWEVESVTGPEIQLGKNYEEEMPVQIATSSHDSSVELDKNLIEDHQTEIEEVGTLEDEDKGLTNVVDLGEVVQESQGHQIEEEISTVTKLDHEKPEVIIETKEPSETELNEEQQKSTDEVQMGEIQSEKSPEGVGAASGRQEQADADDLQVSDTAGMECDSSYNEEMEESSSASSSQQGLAEHSIRHSEGVSDTVSQGTEQSMVTSTARVDEVTSTTENLTVDSTLEGNTQNLTVDSTLEVESNISEGSKSERKNIFETFSEVGRVEKVQNETEKVEMDHTTGKKPCEEEHPSQSVTELDKVDQKESVSQGNNS